MTLNINGRMKVKTLKSDFKKAFGLTIRVYDGRSFADDDVTLASIRKGDSVGGEFSPKRNIKVGNVEEKIMELFGLKTQVAGSDDSYLCDNDHTLAKALEVDEGLMDKRSSKNSDAKEEKSKAKPAEVTSQATMSLTNIIEEIKITYSNHEDYEDMMNDLESGENMAYWAAELSTDEFNKNTDLAKSLFEVAIEKAETFNDFNQLGNNISDSDGFNDKTWARELYQSASKLAETLRDIVVLAQSCMNEGYLNDKVWAKELFSLSLEKAKSVNEISSIARMIANMDTDWSKEVFQKSLDMATPEEREDIIMTVEWSINKVTADEMREKYLGK